jgi:hypothetical protein
MESGAKGCEVIVSGKLRAARAKAMKFKDGYMISSGNPTKEFIDSAVRHVLLRQGAKSLATLPLAHHNCLAGFGLRQKGNKIAYIRQRSGHSPTEPACIEQTLLHAST